MSSDLMTKAISDVWQKGYRAGYRAAHSDMEELQAKLNELITRIESMKPKEVVS